MPCATATGISSSRTISGASSPSRRRAWRCSARCSAWIPRSSARLSSCRFSSDPPSEEARRVTETIAGSSAVDELAERFWNWFLERQPIYGTMLGYEHLDDRLPDDSERGRAEEVAGLKAFQAEAAAVESGALDTEEEITLDMLQVVTRIALRQHEQELHHFAGIDQMAGPQGLPGELSMIQRVDTPERVDRLVRRLERYPEYMAAQRDNMQAGLRAGRTAARPVVQRVVDQTRRIVATPLDEAPLLAAHPELDGDARNR